MHTHRETYIIWVLTVCMQVQQDESNLIFKLQQLTWSDRDASLFNIHASRTASKGINVTVK